MKVSRKTGSVILIFCDRDHGQARNERGDGVVGLKMVVTRGPAGKKAPSLSLVTRRDGFTSDLHAPGTNEWLVTQPLTGHWRIAATNHALATTAKDLVVFFVYSYDERQASTRRAA